MVGIYIRPQIRVQDLLPRIQSHPIIRGVLDPCISSHDWSKPKAVIRSAHHTSFILCTSHCHLWTWHVLRMRGTRRLRHVYNFGLAAAEGSCLVEERQKVLA
jgi:hypothetical protein